jgi:hypothetical protein
MDEHGPGIDLDENVEAPLSDDVGRFTIVRFSRREFLRFSHHPVEIRRTEPVHLHLLAARRIPIGVLR